MKLIFFFIIIKIILMELDKVNYDTLYSYKSNKLVQLELVSETFMTTKDPNNEDHKILQELTEKLQGSRIKDGLLLDINYKMANEILNYLETEHFKNILDRIVKIQN